MATDTHSYDEGVPSRVATEELSSSDLSYLSDIQEEANTESFALSSSPVNSSALNSSQLSSSARSDISSNISDTGFFSLDWRAELTPGTVSLGANTFWVHLKI